MHTKKLTAAVMTILMLLIGGCQSPDEGVTINGVTVPPVPELDSQQVAQGEVLYNQQCAACHGAELEGAPNWQSALPDGSFPPPPQDDSGHTWHHSDAYLLEVITLGGAPIYGGTMPGFGEELTREEIEMILDYIKSNWGAETRQYQWWMTAQ